MIKLNLCHEIKVNKVIYVAVMASIHGFMGRQHLGDGDDAVMAGDG